MSEPKTGGAITGGNWGYSGSSRTSGNNNSNKNSNSNGESIDLSVFAINTNLENYEGKEISAKDVLSLGKGPLNPDLFTEEGRKKIEEKATKSQYENEVRLSMSRMGYNETDIQRVLNGELTQEELYNEIFQEYLSGKTDRMQKLIEASVISEGFYYSTEETQSTRDQYQEQIEFVESEDFQLKLDALQSDYDMYSEIATGCREVAAVGGEYYIYTNSIGEEVQIPVSQAENFESLAERTKSQLEYMGTLQSSVGEMKSEVARLDEILANPEQKEFKYSSVEEIDERLAELDAEIAVKRKEYHDKLYGYDIPDEAYKDPEFLLDFLSKQNITYWTGLNNKDENKNTYGWSVMKVGKNKYGIYDGSRRHMHIDIYGNESYDSYTAEELIANGFYIVPMHCLDLSRVTEEDKAELAALEAERKELKDTKSAIEAYTEYYIKYGKYLLKDDFADNSKPKSRDKLTINNASVLFGWEGPIYGNLYDKMSELLGHQFSFPEDPYNTEEENDNEYMLGYLLYDEISMGSTDNPLYNNYVGGLQRDVGEYDEINMITFHQKNVYQNYATKWSSVMNETEKAIFYYICNTVGYDAGYRYLEEISYSLDTRYKNAEQEKEYAWATECFGNSLWASVRSIFLKPIEGIQALGYSLEAVRKDSKIYRSNIISRSDWDRGAISEKLAQTSKALAFFYGLGMSMSDSAVIIGLTIASGGAYGTVYTALLIGPSVYVSTLNDALDRNFSDKEAVGMALLFSAVEVAMESYSLSHLLHADANVAEVLKRFPKLAEKVGKLSATGQKQFFVLYTILSQSFVEMDEEVWTTLLDRGIDWSMEQISSTGKSQFTMDYEMYKSLHPNCTDDEAYSFAYGQFFHGLFEDAAGGLISGSIFGKITAGKMFGFKSSNRSGNFNSNSNTNTNGIPMPGKPGIDITLDPKKIHANQNTNTNNESTNTTVTPIQLEQMDAYLADGNLNSLVEMSTQNNNPALTNKIQSKMTEYVSGLNTTELTNLILNNDFNEKTINMLVQAITDAYKEDGTGFKADMKAVYDALKIKYPQIAEFYKFIKDNNSQWYIGQEDKFETWMVLQCLQAQKLANNTDIDMLNLLNSQFAANGLPTYTNAVDAYFATLALCCNIRQQIYTLTTQNTPTSKALANQLMQEYMWLQDVTREIAIRNGHDPSTVKAVSFFQSSRSSQFLLDKGHDVGRADTTNAFNGGTACCNVEAVDSWIMFEMANIMEANPNATAAEIEKLFIDGYFDFAALQNISEWEAGYYRAIATNITGNLDTTAGLHNSCFDLEWCLGGETLGMQEEFMLKHGKLTAADVANLSPTTPTTVPIYDQSGKQIGSYELKYCTGLQDTLGEMYTSGRMTEAEKIKIADWYKSIYGTDISADYH